MNSIESQIQNDVDISRHTFDSARNSNYNIFKTKIPLNSLTKYSTDEYIVYPLILPQLIIKTFYKKEYFDLEIYIHYKLNFLKLDIIPRVVDIKYNGPNGISSIFFNCNSIISLRKHLNNIVKNKINYTINELLSFLKNIKNKGVLINNLHIDTLFINPTNLKFYIFNISKITFKSSRNTFTFNDLDIQSLYTSLNELKYEIKIKKYLKKEISNTKT